MHCAEPGSTTSSGRFSVTARGSLLRAVTTGLSPVGRMLASPKKRVRTTSPRSHRVERRIRSASRRRQPPRHTDGVGVHWWWAILLGVVAFVVPSQWARLRSRGRIKTVRTVPATEVALVLGAGVRLDGQPSRILGGRLDIAHDLFLSGKVERLLLSGSPKSRGHSEPIVMRTYLLNRGIPASRLTIDESGVDTWRSCVGAADSYGLRRVIVVTTAFHLHRAVWLCRKAGMEAYGVGHDAHTDGLRRVSARGARREILATIKAFWWPRYRAVVRRS